MLGIAILFATLKLAGMLYDLVFINIIAPIVVASDAHGNGRAKKMISEMVTTYIIFILVVFLLKIYINAIDVILSADINFIIQMVLIIMGAKFVIDGPDIIVKLTGTDAGVKSGYGALMGMRAATSMATGAARSATRIGRTAAHIGKKGASGTAGAVSGAVAGAGAGLNNAADLIGGALGGAISGARAGANGQGGNALQRGSAAGMNTGDRITSPLGRRDDNTSTDATDNSSASSTNNSSGGASSGGATDTSASTSNTEKTTASPADGNQQQTPQIVKGEKGDKGDRGDKEKEGNQNSNKSSYEKPFGNAFNTPASTDSSSAPAPEPTYADTQRATEQGATGFAQQERVTEAAPANEGYAQQERKKETPKPDDGNQ